MTVNPAIYGLLLSTFVLTVIAVILVVERIWLWIRNRSTANRNKESGFRSFRTGRLA